ncbi:MAG: hypothetical protein B6243_07490 [Anaerolineaceae bacterium 4572_5.2]|nr:MAG: hypothetical protein B6243_07490 [Anaerolineaceae bacterium 4572_5.2]
MATEVIMPKLGLTMTEGTIVSWLKQEGETVEKGDALLEIETDKVVLGVEAPAGGTLLKILADTGETTPLAQIIGYIGEPGEKLPQPETAPTDAAPLPSPQPAVAKKKTPASQIKTSPLAKRLAGEYNIDLSTVAGTGPQGRIVKEDIQRVIEAQKVNVQSAPAPPVKASPLAKRLGREHNIELSTVEGTGPQGRIVEVDIRRIIESKKTDTPAESMVEVVPSQLQSITRIQRLTARRMSESFQTAPHFYLNIEINLGVATATEQGLVVSVIHQAESLSLEEIIRARTALSQKAKDGKFSPDDVTGGTFTFTNLGMFGIDDFTPILNPPQSAILAAGAIVERPVGENGQVVLRPTLRLTLAIDHRVADGVDGAMFLKDLRALLDSPETLFR